MMIKRACVLFGIKKVKALVMLLILTLLMTNGGMNFAEMTPNHTHSLYLNEYTKNKVHLQYLSIQSKAPQTLTSALNKTLYDFFVTSTLGHFLSSEKADSLTAESFVEYQLIGNLGVFKRCGLNTSFDPEVHVYMTSLHLNLNTNQVYGLNDLFDTKSNYLQKLETLILEKSQGNQDMTYLFQAKDMISDGTFEVTPGGIKFFIVYRGGYQMSAPPTYYEVLLEWHQIEDLINKEGAFWKLIQGQILIQRPNNQALTFNQWGYAQVKSPTEPKRVNVVNLKGEVVASVLGLEALVSPKTALVKKEGAQGHTLINLFDSTELYQNITSDFSEGVAAFASRVQDKDLYGYVDRYGRVTIPSQFLAAYPFINGLALVQRPDQSFALINYQGKVMTLLKGSIQAQAETHTTLVYKDPKTGLFGAIDANNKEVIKPLYLHLDYLPQYGLFMATSPRGTGLIDYKSRLLTDWYKSISSQDGRLYKAIGLDGKVVSLLGFRQYDDIIKSWIPQ